MQVED